MKPLADILARAISIMLYPLFIPTYGVALFCYVFSVYLRFVSLGWSLVAVIGTLVLTCVLPITAIGIMIRSGKVSDLEITDSTQRTMPYIYTIFGFSCWSYLMITILHAPRFMGWVAVGATVALGLVAFINRWWKISAHLTGMGGLFGGLMSFYLGIGMMPSWGMPGLLLTLSLLLMYARVRVNAHTPAQVCVGWLLGITCTFIPYCIYQYVV